MTESGAHRRRAPRLPARPALPAPVARVGAQLRLPVAEVARYWHDERHTVRQGFVALLIAALADLGAGLVLGSSEGELERLPGLLVLIPAAIAMRGSTFGALGARIGTAILTGEYHGDVERGGWLWRQVQAVAVLTLWTSLTAAVLAEFFAISLGQRTVGLLDLLTISVLGGVLASLVLLVVTVGLARTAYRRGWNMDDVAAPAITATGDLVAIPALLVASLAARQGAVTTVVAAVAIVLTAAALVWGWRYPRADIRRVVRESVVVLTLAAGVSILAGVVIQEREDLFLAVPALLVLFPPFVAIFGALGGMLSSRLTSKIHLGTLEPRIVPGKVAVLDFSLTYLFAVVVFAAIGVATSALATALGLAAPTLPTLVAVTVVGGLLGTTLLSIVSYTAATATSRFGLDPDNHAIPIVTSAMDFLGILVLIAAMAIFQVG